MVLLGLCQIKYYYLIYKAEYFTYNNNKDSNTLLLLGELWVEFLCVP